MRDTRPPFPHAFRPCRGPRRSRESPCADAPRRWRAAPHLLSVNPPAARSGRRRAWRTCARPSRGRSGSQTRRRRDRHAGTRILPEQELVRSAATPSKVAPCTWARGAFAVRAQRCVGDVCSRTVQRGARAQSQSAALHIGGTAESSARTGARASRLGPRGAPRDCPPRRAGTAESPGPVESEASAVGAAVATGTSRSVPMPRSPSPRRRRRDTRARGFFGLRPLVCLSSVKAFLPPSSPKRRYRPASGAGCPVRPVLLRPRRQLHPASGMRWRRCSSPPLRRRRWIPGCSPSSRPSPRWSSTAPATLSLGGR